MTARVVLACDGEQAGERCRQAIPVGEVLSGVEARRGAKKHGGWSSYVSNTGIVVDLCPSCTKRRNEGPTKTRCRCASGKH